MTEQPGGLHLLADELDSRLVTDMLGWRDHPELSRLLTKLLSHGSRKAFFDSFAEAIVARHVLTKGCEIRFEVPTPRGKRCDFEIQCGETKMYLHIKRANTDRPPQSQRHLASLARRLRRLEDIPRPYIVQARWSDGISGAQMKLLVAQAEEFIKQAKIGEEMTAQDVDGRAIGGVRVIAPWDGEHVNVMIGLKNEFVDQAQRFRRLLSRAYQQFMPREDNVILICSSRDEDVVDCEAGLLGSYEERWDAFPPAGQRVAHGRAADGFWNDQRHAESHVVVWFQFTPDDAQWKSRLWFRGDDADHPRLRHAASSLFEAEKR